MSTLSPPPRKRPKPLDPTPAWEIARFFPLQGEWSVDDYLDFNHQRGLEFTNGYIEVLPVPTEAHQLILGYLFKLLSEFVEARQLGWVLPAGIRIRLRKRKFREPDVTFLRKENAALRGKEYWRGADLVMEIVSGEPKDRDRDYIRKRRDYAQAGIAEYWIVDPDNGSIAVLVLDGKKYRVHGKFGSGQTADSPALPGFKVAVDEMMAKGTA